MQTSRNTPGSLGIQVSHDATSSRVAQLEYWLPPMLSIVEQTGKRPQDLESACWSGNSDLLISEIGFGSWLRFSVPS